MLQALSHHDNLTIQSPILSNSAFILFEAPENFEGFQVRAKIEGKAAQAFQKRFA